MVDDDHSGEISKTELFATHDHAVGTECSMDTDSTLFTMWVELDQSGDGSVSFEEWMDFWARYEKNNGTGPAEVFLMTMKQHLKMHLSENQTPLSPRKARKKKVKK